MSQSPYRVFCSVDGDWYVAAKKKGHDVHVLHAGHGLDQCYEAIMEDAGVDAPHVEKDMGEGGFQPKAKDWKD